MKSAKPSENRYRQERVGGCRGQVSGTAVALMAALTLAGCTTVGPDFRPPQPPVMGSYTATALPGQTVEAAGVGGVSQRFVSGKEIPEAWWTLFRCDPLDRLIRQAIDESPTLALARARIVEAQENRRAQFGALLPNADANLSYSRQKIAGVEFGQSGAQIDPFTLMGASVNVSYTFDLFGATRRQLEALDAQIEFQQFQLEGAHLTLSSTIVVNAVREASLRSKIRATQEIIALQEQALRLVERRLELGHVPASDLLAQRAQLAQTLASLPPLERDLEQTRHQLAVLTGKLPAEAALPEFHLAEMHLPEELPLSLPSSLARQRPDIRAAEALLHAASARVGVATAHLYPQVTLTGSFGSMSDTPGSLFNGPSTIWNLGAGLLQPLFRGGTLSAQKRAAVALYDQAMAEYRQTLLTSFQNVADVLRALEADARGLKAQTESEAIAAESLDLTRKQFERGAVNFLSLLNGQRQYQEALLNTVQAQAARFSDTAALFQSLGGGWWSRGPQHLAEARLAGE
ncbi:MAG: efflux transporter outer membrane subunit [Deltaproteobacteria bacterium]|nr:efflux transporter outer membrane subunit [Deltaproteobacteria bacterium]